MFINSSFFNKFHKLLCNTNEKQGDIIYIWTLFIKFHKSNNNIRKGNRLIGLYICMMDLHTLL